MSLVDLLKEKVEKQLAAYDEQLEAAEAEAKARRAKAEADVADAELDQQLLIRVNEIKDKVAKGRAYLNQLANAGDDKVDELKTRLARFFD